MRSIILCLGALAAHVSCRSLGLSQRSSPTFLDNGLAKRANPQFEDGDFGENEDEESKKQLLKHGIEDTYKLVSTALRHWQDDIFDHWFPAGKDNIIAALLAIVPEPVLKPGVGGDDLENFRITPEDFQQGEGEKDFCLRGADAYTSNRGTDEDPSALVHFCPQAFDVDQPMRLSDLDCEEDFKFSNGRYRVTNEMDSLGATILHEMIHFNSIGGKTGLTKKDKNGSLVSDIGGEEDGNPVEDVGDPYASWALRQTSDSEHDMCIINADNYVWLVLELYWTHKCRHKLRDQNGRFDAPQA